MTEGLRYRPADGRFDEAVAPDGSIRPAWRGVAGVLAEGRHGELLERQRQADRMLDAEGAGHLVHDLGGATGLPASTPWRLDPVPIVLGEEEFDLLAAAVEQRSRALEAVLADLHGPRRLLREGIIPAGALAATAALRMSAIGQSVPRWLVHHAVDVVRAADGSWRVVGDLTDSPTGLGYALLNRSVMARVMADQLRESSTAALVQAPTVLRRALAALAPGGRADSRTVVLSGGPDHPSYVEQSYLAVQMGLHLAEGADLVVRQHRVWLRALDTLEPIDVVYRRVDDRGLDPLEVRAAGTQGVPAITWAARAGGVALANAFGSGVVESTVVGDGMADAARLLLGEELLLPAWRASDDLATTPLFDATAGFVPWGCGCCPVARVGCCATATTRPSRRLSGPRTCGWPVPGRAPGRELLSSFLRRWTSVGRCPSAWPTRSTGPAALPSEPRWRRVPPASSTASSTRTPIS
jgi:uncharacterized circularly permuted ATP-grasp superfamily protein